MLTTPTRYWEAAFRIAVFSLFFKQSHTCFSLKNKQKMCASHACFSLKNKQKMCVSLMKNSLSFWAGTLPKTTPFGWVWSEFWPIGQFCGIRSAIWGSAQPGNRPARIWCSIMGRGTFSSLFCTSGKSRSGCRCHLGFWNTSCAESVVYMRFKDRNVRFFKNMRFLPPCSHGGVISP